MLFYFKKINPRHFKNTVLKIPYAARDAIDFFIFFKYFPWWLWPFISLHEVCISSLRQLSSPIVLGTEKHKITGNHFAIVFGDYRTGPNK